MTAPAVSGIYLNVVTGRWELVVGSEVWGDYDTQGDALAAQDDYEDDVRRRSEPCTTCGGNASDPCDDLRHCRACGGSGLEHEAVAL